MKHRCGPCLRASVAAATLAALSTAAPAAVVLKVATLAPEGSAWMNAIEWMNEDLSAAIGGEVKLRVYPAGVMGEERDGLVKIEAGQLDGGGFIGNGIDRICPEANALMLPLTLNDTAEADAAIATVGPYLEERCLANGYVVLGFTEVGFRLLFSNREIRMLEDLRGAKVWALPNEPMLAELFKQAGIGAIPVPVADVLAALQTGLMDTLDSPPLAAVAMQWTGHVKHLEYAAPRLQFRRAVPCEGVVGADPAGSPGHGAGDRPPPHRGADRRGPPEQRGGSERHGPTGHRHR